MRVYGWVAYRFWCFKDIVCVSLWTLVLDVLQWGFNEGISHDNVFSSARLKWPYKRSGQLLAGTSAIYYHRVACNGIIVRLSPPLMLTDGQQLSHHLWWLFHGLPLRHIQSPFGRFDGMTKWIEYDRDGDATGEGSVNGNQMDINLMPVGRIV